ncbi:porin [Paraburkholderia sp. Ac-20347]|jgi:predicted porin|uniref:porin n=1 Tax=Paraburkholderia sp. Ac-20347 TaxID=2703892 RepID=UPI00197E537D|nr:porin [Paraburkholderia sp. Ac-20347]MBN3811564.1 porin [Paraburkholderia sp. Ac-20347]
MKKTALALAATLASIAGVAHAQSSVTLYGALDTSVAFFGNQKGSNGSGNTFQMMSGNMSPNLWGLKGTEDLGSGLSAIFKIESGFNIDNGKSGQGGRLFGRTAMVGLNSTQGGTVSLGRQYDPLIDLLQPMTDDVTFGSAFATPGDMDNYDNSYRTSNSIKYTSPNYAGLQVSAMYAFGGQAGSMGAGQTWAVAAAYNHGPFGFGAGYFKANSNSGTAATFDGLNPNTDVNVDSSAITGGFVSANSLQIIRAVGDYSYGPMTFGLAYSNVDYANYQSAAGANSDTKFNTGQLFVNYQVTPVAVLGFGYNYTKGSGNGVNASYNQFSLGGDYFLSKRTDIYALAGYQKASGRTIDADTGALVNANASFGDFGNDATTNKQAMAMVGIRHHF